MKRRKGESEKERERNGTDGRCPRDEDAGNRPNCGSGVCLMLLASTLAELIDPYPLN